jgi:hypothetical protein
MRLIILSAACLSLALPALASAAPASWQETSERTAMRATAAAPNNTTGYTLRVFPIPVHPDAKVPKFFVNFVTGGIAVGGVPCFNCVNGAPASALGLPGPFNYVPSSTVMQYNVSWTNLLWNGSCTATFTITAGTQVLDTFGATVSGVSGAGAYDLGFNRNRPTYSGPAVLMGTIKCGRRSSSTTAHLIFQ